MARFPLYILVAALTGWVTRQQQAALAYLVEENRVLRAHVRGRLRLTDTERRRLAARGRVLGRRQLQALATIVTPDTLLRWHRQLIARKWTAGRRRAGRPGVMLEIRRLVVQLATENPTWGYTRIQGALQNLDHRVARSTIAKVLREQGPPPVPERPTSWQTFLRAHWAHLVGADFFTTEVWTARGLITYYTLFVIELKSRRVRIVGSTPHPDGRFMHQVARGLVAADEGPLSPGYVLVCDRDAKWSGPVRAVLASGGVRMVQTPVRAPNANAYAERFVRSIKAECLNRVVPLGEGHFRHLLREYVAHYHHERNHQGVGNAILQWRPPARPGPQVRRRPRLGGLLNYYCRAA
jgi:transposase InsO family protein